MNIYSDTELKLGSATRVGSLGKTNIAKKKISLASNSNKIDKDYTKHNIKFTKEIDRLVFTGQFKREDKVNIILKKNTISNYYEIKVSKKPYTALCVDIFSEEENKNGIVINRYINAEGLSGTYSIYLEINGKIYDTKESVKF